MIELPRIIYFQKIGSAEEGFLSISNGTNITGFNVKRVFWNYATPEDITRGRHAHYKTEMVLVAVKGRIAISTKTIKGIESKFVLSDPNQGLYLPKLCWHEMIYSDEAVQLVLCSTTYDESDYIRSKATFENLIAHHSHKKS